jgi:hypothetical protein
MGYERHHAIIVTSWSKASIEAAHQQATTLFAETFVQVTDVTAAGMNDYRSFLVAPDGSKEGWHDSDAGDAARAAFIAWLGRQTYEDGSSNLDWVEIHYGGDDQEFLEARDSIGCVRRWEDAAGELLADASNQEDR